MERTNRAVTSRRTRTNARNVRGMYVDGNTVRRLQEVPQRRAANDYPAQAQGGCGEARLTVGETCPPDKQGNDQKPRESHEHGAVDLYCVPDRSVRGDHVFCGELPAAEVGDHRQDQRSGVSGERSIPRLKEENDAYYSQVTSNVDLNKIKRIAIGRLGMNYPTDEQKKTYTMSSNSYVRQYQDVPGSVR